MRKTTMAVAMAAMTFAVTSPVAGAPAEKVDVCHAEGTGDYHKINVNENAFETHVDHGDASPGEGVPSQPGMVFSDECVPSIAVGSFSNQYSGSLLATGFTLFQTEDGTYFGTATYSYGADRSATVQITDACVDVPNKRVTVRGDVTDATGTILVGDEGAISIQDNGSTVSTRVGSGSSVDSFFDEQCGSSPKFPASGSTGSLIFAT